VIAGTAGVTYIVANLDVTVAATVIQSAKFMLKTAASGHGGGGQPTILWVSAANVTVEDCVFDQQNQTNSVGVELAGAATNAAVRGNRFTNTRAAGVHLSGACSDALIEGNRFGPGGYGVLTADTATCTRINIVGNTFNGTNLGDAIEINTPTGGATEVNVVGNTIAGYSLTGGSSGIGIGFAHVVGGSMVGNTITGCGLDGIHLEDGTTGITVSGNRVYNCGRAGITVNSSNAARYSQDITIIGNLVSGCLTNAGTGGIASEGTQPRQNIAITGNRVVGCGRAAATCYGIDLQFNCNRHNVTGNIVSNTIGSTTAGINLSRSTGTQIVDNHCFDDQGVKTQQYGIIIADNQTELLLGVNYLVGNLTGTILQTGIGTTSNYRRMFAQTRDDIAATGFGLGGQNYPFSAFANGQIAIDGTFYFCALPFRAGDVISNVVLHCNTGGATLTLSKAGVWALDGQTQLAVSADLGSAWQTAGRKDSLLTAPYTVLTDGLLYLGFVCKGTTLPTFVRGSNGVLVPATGWTTVPFGSVTGKTDAPATFTPAAPAGTIGYWMAWS
jgi:parallel beta-helix repeat protein